MHPFAAPWPLPAVRTLLFAGLWLVIAGADPAAWLIGVPAVAAATWASLRLEPDSGLRLSPAGALRFSRIFLWESLRGGLDVARRTLGRRLDIRTGFVTHRNRLPAGRSRLLFVNCVSLLPGTLAADLRDDFLLVHLLDTGTDAARELARLEDAVAGLFGIALEAPRD
jgi:multicomponent Na+:H+ antiporter subunit E